MSFGRNLAPPRLRGWGASSEFNINIPPRGDGTIRHDMKRTAARFARASNAQPVPRCLDEELLRGRALTL